MKKKLNSNEKISQSLLSWVNPEWLLEDLGFYDLTTQLLGIGRIKGHAEVFAREQFVVAGSEHAAEIYRMTDRLVNVKVNMRTGDFVHPNDVILRATGPAEALHMAWRAAQEVIAYASGVATSTNSLVKLAKNENPKVVIATTRKTPPGLKDLYFTAVMAGGGVIHRCCLSDGVLLFKNHMTFLVGKDLNSIIRSLKSANPLRPVGIEVETPEEAIKAVEAGADYVQLEHMNPEKVSRIAAELRKINNRIIIGASGGIDEKNVKKYAKLVDLIVTSAPYSAKPVDVGTRIIPARY
jgi:molybdenum transport protein